MNNCERIKNMSIDEMIENFSNYTDRLTECTHCPIMDYCYYNRCQIVKMLGKVI